MTAILERGIRFKPARTCGDDGVDAGREPIQMGWYALAGSLAKGMSVLDVGCGMGEGMIELKKHASSVAGIDMDDRLRRPDLDIQVKNITEVPDKSHDAIVCVDVIEHVERDAEFVAQLVRVARKLVFVSTPKYALGLNRWPYHYREYTPRQLGGLLEPYGAIRVFGGTQTGETTMEIPNREHYYMLCDMYGYYGANYLAKVLRRISSTRIWQHQAVVLQVGAGK